MSDRQSLLVAVDSPFTTRPMTPFSEQMARPVWESMVIKAPIGKHGPEHRWDLGTIDHLGTD